MGAKGWPWRELGSQATLHSSQPAQCKCRMWGGLCPPLCMNALSTHVCCSFGFIFFLVFVCLVFLLLCVFFYSVVFCFACLCFKRGKSCNYFI